MKKILAIFLVTCFMLAGCRPKLNPSSRIVKQITVNREGISRSYTDSRQMEPILTYLRILGPKTPAKGDPQALPGQMAEIVLTLADGSSVRFLQKENRYICQDGSSWQTIRPERGILLWHLLPLLEAPALE